MESEVEIGLEDRLVMTSNLSVEKMGWDIGLTKVSNNAQQFQWNEDFIIGPAIVNSWNVKYLCPYSLDHFSN